MLAHEIRRPKGAKRARKRIGRGDASGHGSYSGRGMKGQKSRSGNKPKLGFEGGQTKLIKRLPRRRGFTNVFRTRYFELNLRQLERFGAGSDVTPQRLQEEGLIKSLRRPVKILGDGELGRPLTVHAHKFSKSARAKIEAAGGKALEVEVKGDDSS
ncbi:MAG: 50S ribosomal protein L15 [Dehalococcoidia bacterium]